MRLTRSRALLLVILVFGMGSWLLLRGFDAAPSELEQLLSRFEREVACERPVEGRLSWLLPYAAFNPEPPDGSGSELSVDRLEAQIGLNRLARDQESAPTVAAAGVADLIEGNAEAAITRLEHAAELAPEDPAVLSDLAAAYLSRARRNDAPYDIVLALESAERAALADPDFVPARFNVAVALERLHLLDAAAGEWKKYAKIDQGSAWAKEAMSRAQRIASRPVAMSWEEAKSRLEQAVAEQDAAVVKEVVRGFPRLSMEYAVIEVLGSWAEALLSEDTQAARKHLRRAYLVAEALTRESGDALAQDAVDVVRRESRTAVRSLGRAHQALWDGAAAAAGGDRETARQRLGAALMQFRRAGSPAYWLAAYELARSYYRAEDDKLIKILEPAAVKLADAPYPIVGGRIAWLAGLTLLELGRPAEALDRYRFARRSFAKAGAESDGAALATLLAEAQEYLGTREAAWRHRVAALQGLDLFTGEPRRVFKALQEAARSLILDNHLATARHFQSELVRLAELWGNAEALVFARIQRSRTGRLLDDPERAREDLEAAADWLSRIDSSDRRDRMWADLLAERASHRGVSSPEDALSDISKALGFFTEQGRLFQATALYGERARLLKEQNRREQARQDLEEGIRAVEKQRSKLSDPLKTSWLDQSRQLFEALVAIEVEVGNFESAFGAVERGRARSLLDALSATPTSTLEAVRQTLGQDVTLLEYFSLEDRLLVWVVRHDGFDFFQVPVPRLELAQQVAELENAILLGEENIEARASALYDAILREPMRIVASDALLMIVPGAELARVPFSTLVNRESGRYLIEDHALGIWPSATLLVQARALEPLRPSETEVVVIGNPAFSSQLFPSFRELPGAEIEALRIASIYPGSELLIGADATKKRLLAAAGTADIIHFAGHSVANEWAQQLSLLVLAEDAALGDGGALYAHEIAGEDWRGTELVVLSSCSGAGGPESPTEGVLSLSRAFLLGGASTVLGSYWPVDDRETARLFEMFHVRIAAGDSTYEALRTAQIGLVRSAEVLASRPHSWAAFAIVGGSSIGSTPSRLMD